MTGAQENDARDRKHDPQAHAGNPSQRRRPCLTTAPRAGLAADGATAAPSVVALALEGTGMGLARSRKWDRTFP